ncbi:30S ribosomal protein S16 [Candidatus Falkowbacteria bacterium]|nr:30S ribosomal protein S16 [Candidatus Falkowbacteria bacterium]
MLKIRLTRFGTNKRPTYRLTVCEHTKDAKGDVTEYLGAYNPRSNPKFVDLKVDKIKGWMAKGAQCSPTVHNLLVSQGVISGKKVQAWKPKKKDQPVETKSITSRPAEVKVETAAPAPAAKAEVETQSIASLPTEPQVGEAPAEPQAE